MKKLLELQEIGSSNAKQRVLKTFNENEVRTFLYAYNVYCVYHLNYKIINMDNLGEPNDELFVLLDSILNKDYSAARIKMEVETFAAYNGDLIKLIISKKLHCGVNITTFNKVWPKAIPSFEVQLAKEVKLNTINYPILAQLKYDGVRLIAINRNGIVTFKTRNGKEVYLPMFKEIIESIPAVNYILDGEIVFNTGLQDDRTRISGAINSAIHGGKVNEFQMVLYCFDFMTLHNWEENICLDKYSYRFSILREVINQCNNPIVSLATTNEVYTNDAMLALYESALLLRYEGLVLKDENHLYTFKRSKDWIKIKKTISVDLKCIDIQEGEGKYKGMIGALICEGDIEDKHIIVKVGSGLTDLQRALPYSEFAYRTIEIKYNTIIQDSGTKEWSLFLPRFKQVRIDK